VSGQLQEHRAGGREFQVLGDATEKLRVPNDVRVKGYNIRCNAESFT